ncbi:hypothetical protein [Noviherbaspirillum massiliense]|uniref:hypothetical protein n=1 Tax=Noviherbaspirillum massiliense TaxID=1465823 RepID=UPI00030F4EA3|nr:hypothetical protein [Noviherbaspirillum massiliense]
MQFKTYISYSPVKPGSVFAVFYFEKGNDVYGWHVEARSHYFSAAFFMIDHFYANHPSRLYRSIEDDVYGPWAIDYPPMKNEIRCPVPESIGHELERMQSMFVEEWLFFKNDPGVDPELATYESQGLPVHAVGIKAKRLPRLDKNHSSWIYATPGMNSNVVELLRKYWRLSDKLPVR